MGEMREEKKGRDVQGLVNHISLMFSYVNEHGIDAFHELVKANPDKAADELPRYLGKILNAGDGFFNGTNCGGPHEGVTAPLLDSIGMIYPCLDKTQREKALRSCLSFLDGLNYSLAQENVARINEPWLIGDIITNRAIYWCGFKEYDVRQKKAVVWSDWENEFLDDDGRIKANSLGWLAVSVFWKDYCAPAVREGFTKRFSTIVDRVKDAVAGWAHIRGVRERYEEKPRLYQEAQREYLKHFVPQFAAEIPAHVEKENFIVLEETVSRFEQSKEWREHDKREKDGNR